MNNDTDKNTPEYHAAEELFKIGALIDAYCRLATEIPEAIRERHCREGMYRDSMVPGLLAYQFARKIAKSIEFIDIVDQSRPSII